MEERDKISDNYRRQVDEILDVQSDLNRFNPLDQEEADEIWEEISVELDIDEVWNGISSNLDIVMPVDSGLGILVKSFIVVLIILIGLIPVKEAILDSGINQPEISTENKPNERPAELIIKNKSGDSNIRKQVKEEISPPSKSILIKSGDGNKRLLAERKRTILTQEKTILVSNKIIPLVLAAPQMADSYQVGSMNKATIERSSITPVLIPGDLKKINVFFKTNFDSLKINNNSPPGKTSLPFTDRAKISGGVITSLKNTWLLNNETLNGLKSESLNSTEIVFFPDVGLSLSYSINKNWLLQADGFFSSNTGQKYFDYINGHYSRKTITLNYSTIDLSVKYKFIHSGNLQPHFSINVLAGGYISVLHYAYQKVNYPYQKVNTDLESIGSQYRKFDLGVRLGGEFELQIFEQLSLAPGLFLSFGIPNIYKVDSFIRTHNGNAVFNLTFYLH